jgi:hypothetical protein
VVLKTQDLKGRREAATPPSLVWKVGAEAGTVAAPTLLWLTGVSCRTQPRFSPDLHGSPVGICLSCPGRKGVIAYRTPSLIQFFILFTFSPWLNQAPTTTKYHVAPWEVWWPHRAQQTSVDQRLCPPTIAPAQYSAGFGKHNIWGSSELAKPLPSHEDIELVRASLRLFKTCSKKGFSVMSSQHQTANAFYMEYRIPEFPNGCQPWE